MTEIQRFIWSATIDVQITLASTDSNQMEVPRHYYVRVPRNSYFPLHYPETLNYFKDYLLVPGWSERSEWWLQYEGVPLKWNVPIGVLYDTLTGLDPVKRAEEQARGLWHLELRYRSYPDQEILPLPNYSTLESFWMNLMKEACFVMNGSAKSMMVLSKKDTSDLWEVGVVQNNLNRFLQSFDKVKPKEVADLKKIPLRVYITAINKVINIPVLPFKKADVQESESAKTLSECLTELVPDLFPSDSKPLAKAVMHGIEVPLDSTMLGLWREGCYYIDGFLHISLILDHD